MIVDVLMIIAIVAVVMRSGFWESLDEWVSSQWKFHHLPHVCFCGFCQTFWLELVYLFAFAHVRPLYALFGALMAAYAYEFAPAVFGLLKTAYDRLVEAIGRKLL